MWGKNNIKMKMTFRNKNKKAQIMELPFQLIFSLILIAVFLYAAFTGIKYFLERADQAKIGQFLAELENKVGTAWQATEISQSYSLDLPSRIKYVCFGDFSKRVQNLQNTVCPDFERYRQQAAGQGANIFFCPPIAAYSIGAPAYSKISCSGNDCLDFKQSFYCIKNDGKVNIMLEKKLGSSKVVLS